MSDRKAKRADDVDGEGTMFRRALGEVVALSALPAVWAGYRPSQIVEDVAEVLCRVMNLEFVYVMLAGDGPSIAAARAKQPALDARRVTAEAKRLLASSTADVVTIPHPLDATRSLRVFVSGGGGEL